MSVVRSIADLVTGRGITRLCHFTPSRNLAHIFTKGSGLLGTKHLKLDERAAFNPSDLQRLDGHEGHVCCSVQYPNLWFMRMAKNKEVLFPDWVVLFLCPTLLSKPDAQFSTGNAAARYGANLRPGASGFQALFADSVIGKGGTAYRRTVQMPTFVATDDQAEVLIPDQVPESAILGLAVRDTTQARQERLRARIGQFRLPPVVIAPHLFGDPYALSQSLRAGTIPVESSFDE
jgi:hypothetical protein